ncbi:MAG: sulfatase-like hydrolase/transferase [Kiritimatiellae bacterium]|nr:sulfatase-like hydrolase/transferase [Kiritimatiellia bacterium]
MPDARPNILFIMTDQQSATMLSCAGNRWLATPALDALCAGGLRFECAYATNPVCVPSRFSLQTGRMPSAIGMTHNESPVTVPDWMLARTLGRTLQDAGYHTAYAGKTHLPRPLESRVRGDDYAFLTGNARDGCADACVEFLKRAHRAPWFLFASFVNPHDVCHMAINAHAAATGGKGHGNFDSASCEAVLDRARATGDLDAFVQQYAPPLPPNFEIPAREPDAVAGTYLAARAFRRFAREHWTETDWRLHRWLYCRLTERVDAKIGRVLAQLRESGLEESTLVVFTSDHGDHDAAHRLEHKSIPYEEAARVPFIMRLPGAIPAGEVEAEHLVSNGLDLLPTLCDYAGTAVPDGLPGASLRPLAERRPVWEWRERLAVESQFGQMLRSRHHKYFVYDSGENREMLVDLRSDPGETANLAARPEYSAELDRHRELLNAWVHEDSVQPQPALP